MFIGRRLDGSVYGAWTQSQPNDEFHNGIEEVPDEHPDYVAFRDRKKNRVRPPDPRDVQLAEQTVKLAEQTAKLAAQSTKLLDLETRLATLEKKP
jgi:hypothetical protein